MIAVTKQKVMSHENSDTLAKIKTPTNGDTEIPIVPCINVSNIDSRDEELDLEEQQKQQTRERARLLRIKSCFEYAKTGT